MGKILLFKETSDKVLEDMANQESLLSRRIIIPEEHKLPILFGISGSAEISEESTKNGEQKKTSFDVIFHYIPREKPWSKIRPIPECDLVIPVFFQSTLNPNMEELAYLTHKIYTENNAISTFAVRDLRSKNQEAGGKITVVPPPSLTFLRLAEKRKGQFELSEVHENAVIKEETFFKEYFKKPTITKTYYNEVRNRINKANIPPKNYM